MKFRIHIRSAQWENPFKSIYLRAVDELVDGIVMLMITTEIQQMKKGSFREEHLLASTHLAYCCVQWVQQRVYRAV